MSLNQKIIIAIDGYSSCGKSTLAKDMAAYLHYKYLDSGAMYRAVTLFCLQNGIDVNDSIDVISHLPDIKIHFEHIGGKNITFLNDKNVEDEIRSMKVSSQVSEVSVIPEVRSLLVRIQKEMGKSKGIVMDGRDITSVVFPNAELKFFVTADIDTRTQRRHKELVSKGKNIDIALVRKNLIHRDQLDTSRSHSPLVKVKDAFLIDNTYLNRGEQLQVALKFKEFVMDQLTG